MFPQNLIRRTLSQRWPRKFTLNSQQLQMCSFHVVDIFLHSFSPFFSPLMQISMQIIFIHNKSDTDNLRMYVRWSVQPCACFERTNPESLHECYPAQNAQALFSTNKEHEDTSRPRNRPVIALIINGDGKISADMCTLHDEWVRTMLLRRLTFGYGDDLISNLPMEFSTIQLQEATTIEPRPNLDSNPTNR